MAKVVFTNREVREWYLNEVASIPLLNEQWQDDGVSLADRAWRAWDIRHRARVAARALMADLREVELLRKRDLAKYGNPDGPGFDQLLAKANDSGLSDDQAYERILASSSSTDATTDRKFTQ